jgi:hypothetical protein
MGLKTNTISPFPGASAKENPFPAKMAESMARSGGFHPILAVKVVNLLDVVANPLTP